MLYSLAAAASPILGGCIKSEKRTSWDFVVGGWRIAARLLWVLLAALLRPLGRRVETSGGPQ
eukprot:8256128-Pyramimonas_sp.AAC.1